MKFNGRNIVVSGKANVGRNVKIGDNVTIYDNVAVGDDAIICNDTVLGEPLNSYYSDESYENPPLSIGPGCLIRSHSIIYAGCDIGARVSFGHRVTLREHTVVGDSCSIGTLCDIQGHVIIGQYSRLHSNVHIASGCSIGSYAYLYPFCVMTNDPYPPSQDLTGGHIGDFTQVGAHAIILPGVRVGENCLVGAGSVASKAIPPFSLASGDPSKVLMDLREYRVLGKGKLYPWMLRFERGMPWEGIGYENWMAQPRALGPNHLNAGPEIKPDSSFPTSECS